MQHVGRSRDSFAQASTEKEEAALQRITVTRNTRHYSVKPAPLVQTRKIGGLTIHAIQAGGQRLDGGAMFGVVPKPLWEKRIQADERNRIQLGMRCVLIE